MNYDEILKNGEHNLNPPATYPQICIFEMENEIKLPQGYKQWLKYADGGDIFLPAGIQFYGVAHKPLMDPEDNIYMTAH